MVKKLLIAKVSVLMLIVLIAVGVYVYKNYSISTREVLIGFQDEKSKDEINFTKTIKDEGIVDNIEVIYMSSQATYKPEISESKPDAYIWIDNPKRGVTLIKSKLWFNDKNIIISIGTDENQSYRIITNDDYLKKLILGNDI